MASLLEANPDAAKVPRILDWLFVPSSLDWLFFSSSNRMPLCNTACQPPLRPKGPGSSEPPYSVHLESHTSTRTRPRYHESILQGYLAHKKHPLPYAQHRTLGMGLRWEGGVFFMSEVPSSRGCWRPIRRYPERESSLLTTYWSEST